MTKTAHEALRRSDRVLIAAAMIILATVSAAIGASLSYHPGTERLAATRPVPVQRIVAKVVPAALPATPARLGQSDTVLMQLLAEHRCLSEVMYYEARGEGTDGRKAVAEVVFHRMNNGNYGHSICAVVYEGASRRGCQFSFTCDGELARRRSPVAWRQSEVLAARILTGEVRLKNATDGATNFHAISVNPDWADTLERTVQIGNHVFYRNGVRSRAS